MKKFGIVFVVLIASLSSMSWGLLLNNANFDQTTIADGGWAGLPTGWDARGGNADQQNLITSTLTPPAQSGDNTAGLNGVSGTDGGSWIAQIIKTDTGNPILVAPNQTYKVKVWVGRRNPVEGTAGGILKVYLQETSTATPTNIAEATYDLQPNYPATTGQQAVNSWTQQTLYVSTGATPVGVGSQLRLAFRNVSSRTTQHWYQQVVLDNVEISDPYIAKTPSPANNATLVLINSGLSWTAPEAFTPTGYNVYLTADPNVPAGAKVSDNQPGTTYTPSSNLAYNTKYYWRIDALEPNTPNPIVHTGDVWNFTTVPTTPVVTDPANQLVALNAAATFTVVASSPTTMTYEWWKTPDADNNTPSDDTVVGGNSDTLSFAATADAYYYCKVTNGGGSTYSNVANLAIKRNVAHWTLDALGGTGNQYVDSSPEALHPADANGTPTFVAGPGASTGNGVQITSSVGWASAGTWDPSQYSKQITIALWAKWTGDNGTWQGLIGKRNTWGVDTMMWQLEVQPVTGTVDFKNAATTVSSASLPSGQWEHVVVAFDGTTATIYRNGVPAASGAFTLNNGFAANMMLGASQKDDAGMTDFTFNGAMDDIQIYNYALSEIQVADMYLAVRDTYVCLNAYASQYDFNGNCIVDLGDFVALAQQWLNCGRYPASECQ
jgi:hypothetical protein